MVSRIVVKRCKVWYRCTRAACPLLVKHCFQPPLHRFIRQTFVQIVKKKILIISPLFLLFETLVGKCCTLMVLSFLQRRCHPLTRCIKKIADQPCYNVIFYLREQNIHTYIIGHFNPSVRIIDLVSYPTYVLRVNFIHKWRDYLLVFCFDVWPGARTLALRLISQHATY